MDSYMSIATPNGAYDMHHYFEDESFRYVASTALRFCRSVFTEDGLRLVKSCTKEILKDVLLRSPEMTSVEFEVETCNAHVFVTDVHKGEPVKLYKIREGYVKITDLTRAPERFLAYLLDDLYGCKSDAYLTYTLLYAVSKVFNWTGALVTEYLAGMSTDNVRQQMPDKLELEKNVTLFWNGSAVHFPDDSEVFYEVSKLAIALLNSRYSITN